MRSPGALAAPVETANLFPMVDRRSLPSHRRAGGRWRLVAAGLALQVAACAPGGAWQDAAGAGHPLAGRIYQVSTGRFVDRTVLVGDLGRADFVLLGERHANPEHQRLQAVLVEALEKQGQRPRALAFE